jgi:hypothetical protein
MVSIHCPPGYEPGALRGVSVKFADLGIRFAYLPLRHSAALMNAEENQMNMST